MYVCSTTNTLSRESYTKNIPPEHSSYQSLPLVYFLAYRTQNVGLLWPIRAHFGCFVAKLRILWCTFTGLNNAVQKLTNVRYAPECLIWSSTNISPLFSWRPTLCSPASFQLLVDLLVKKAVIMVWDLCDDVVAWRCRWSCIFPWWLWNGNGRNY